MNTGLKMLASAVVASALTAALFLTFWDGSSGERGPVPTPIAAAPKAPAPTDAPADPGWTHDLPPIEGDGVITGRVATEDGEGVPGVVIIARPTHQSSGSARGWLPPEPDAEESARRIAAATYRKITGTRRATTDSNGEYRLSGLGDAGYSLSAHGESHDLRAATGHSTRDVQPGAQVDFTAKAVVTVRFVVDGIDESFGERITVVSHPKQADLKRGGGFGWSPDYPTRRIAPGTWWMQAVQGRNRERVSAPQEVTLVAGSAEVTVALTLLDRPGIRGSVTVADELEVRSIEVQAIRFTGETPPAMDGIRRNRSGKRGRYDERSGRYTVMDLAPGRYLVVATERGTQVSGSAVVDVEDTMVRQDLEIGIENADRFMVVRVLGPDGKPLDARGTRFSMSFQGPQAQIGAGAEAVRRKDGTWFIGPDPRVPADSYRGEGTHRLTVSHSGLGSRTVVFDPETDQELEIRFGNPASLTVRVKGLAQSALDGSAQLFLRDSLPEDGISYGGRSATQAGEVFTMDEVQAGEWLIVLGVSGTGSPIIVDRKPVTLREGENVIDWTLPPYHSLRLITGDKEKSTRLSLKRLDPAGDWMHQFASTGKSGEAVYLFLPPGRYELAGTHRGERLLIPVNIPAQTEIRLE